MKKKFLCALLLLALLLQCICVSAYAAFSTGDQAVVSVNSGKLNVRSDASYEAPVVRSLSNGTIVNIRGRSGNWYKISSGSISGYVHADYLRAKSTGSSSSSSSSIGVGSTAYVATQSGKLNMRSSAGTSAPIIHSLSRNTAVTVLSQSGGWSYIRADGRTGYVMSSYLRTDAPTAGGQSSSGTPVPASTAYVKTAGSSLNLRALANYSGKIIGSIPNGSSVTVLSRSGDWSRVTYGAHTGYVNNSYLTTVNPNAASNANKYNGTIAYTNYAQVLRSGASDTASAVTDLVAGASCTIVTYGDVWSYVRSGSNTGYLRTAGLRMTSQSAGGTVLPSTPVTGTTNVSYTARLTSGTTIRVYSQPSLNIDSYTYMLTIPSGMQFSVSQHATASDGSAWAKIRHNGIIGWVHSAEITAVSAVQTVQPVYSYAGRGYAGTYGAVMRSAENASSSIYTTIPKGTMLDLYSSGTSAYYRVTYNGTTGFVAISDITFTNPNTQTYVSSSVTVPSTSPSSNQYTNVNGTSSSGAGGSGGLTDSGLSIDMILASQQSAGSGYSGGGTNESGLSIDMILNSLR